ncbi:MAG TPA: serine/threonine-protein kinase, partial [Nannocystaceae bacterium]|nr:serine/threonine-protein kinase [Nannocystaceae bacterium]
MSVPSIDSFGGQADAALDSGQEPSLAELMRALARTAEPQLPSLEDGEMIGEHLRIDRRLGKGGMGVVYLAHDLRLDRPVAVKLLARGREDGIARLEREARAMAKLSHPNVAVVHEVGRHRGLPYIAMEYVDGGTARSWLRARTRPWQEIVALYLQAARGLAAAHAAGFVHRDFKPDNVLVGADGRARVADFGLVRLQGGEAREQRSTWAHGDELTSSAHDTATDAVMGTPAYMAPEQKLGADVGPASDQFALCLALDEALAGGHVDPRGRGPRARKVPRWLRRAIARGMAREPEQRWPSVDVLADRLERGLAGRTRRLVIVGVATTALLAAAIGVALGAR